MARSPHVSPSGEPAPPAEQRASDGLETVPLREDGLQLDEHRRFQERFWAAERVAWIAFGLVLLLSLFGFGGGGGPVSHREIVLAGTRIDYPAISRWTATDTLSIRFAPGPPVRSLTLGPEFSDAFDIRTIQPEPREATATSQGMRLQFAVGGDEPAAVFLGIQARTVGRVSYRLPLDSDATAPVSTIVLP